MTALSFSPLGRRFFFEQRTTLHCPVADETRLTAKYDFTLTYRPDQMPAPADGNSAPGMIVVDPVDRTLPQIERRTSMNAITFLGEWALRSAALILCGTLLLRALRVKDPAVRLAAWTAMLAVSLAIPVLAAALPKAAVPVAPIRVSPLPAVHQAVDAPMHVEFSSRTAPPRRINWTLMAATLYALGAGALLLRLAAGLLMSRRLLRASRATGRESQGIEIRESDRVPAPVVLGIVRPAIVLPPDWRDWDAAKFEAVVAHERSHVRRRDPAVQALSAIHRALLWHSPLSWFLHKRIVRAAEDASDDAAVAATSDRASYAEVLLEFMRGPRTVSGVGMARYGRPEDRIHRILDGTALSRGVTRWTLTAILALGAPMAYLAAAAGPQSDPPAPPPPPPAAAPADPAPPAPPLAPLPFAADAPEPPQDAPPPPPPPAQDEPQRVRTLRRYIIVLDNNTTSGSWNSSDNTNPESLRQKYGNRFAWFRKTDDSEFITTDSGVLTELEKAMEPQQEVNRMQGEVNAQQSVVNTLQGRVNSLQGDVNGLQGKVNKSQDLVNQIQSAVNNGDKDEAIRRLEAALQQLRAAQMDISQNGVNQRQHSVNAKQAKVNDEQHKVNEMQHKVNDRQHRVSLEYGRRIEEILNSAAARGLAQRLM